MRITIAAAAALVSAALTAAPAAANDARAAGAAPAGEVAALKAEIVALAERFKGQGDLDGAKQRQFDPLVAALLRANPQPPVRERLDLLEGAWLQIWGPYDYRRDGARGIDPSTDPERIYQVVFRDGFYINVAPRDVRDEGPLREIVLLKGEYAPWNGDRDMLTARFVRLTKTSAPAGTEDLWRLAEAAADGRLEDERAILPGFFVRLFFGGGGLREVYTDDTLRILYGASGLDDRSDEFIYIMRRVD